MFDTIKSIIPDFILCYFFFVMFWDCVIYAPNKNSIISKKEEKLLDLIFFVFNGILMLIFILI